MSQIQELYSNQGIVQGGITGYLYHYPLPQLSGLEAWMNGSIHLPEALFIRAAFAIYLPSLLMMSLGRLTRLATVVAWALHFILIKNSFLSVYGVDQFANIILFYLIWMPTQNKWSKWSTLALKVLQIHLCVVYFTAGYFKALGPQWWNGEAIWRTLSLPMFGYVDLSWVAFHPWMAKLAGWGTMAIELGYPLFIWSRHTRTVWVILVVGMHIVIALATGLVSFSLMMIGLTLTAFWVPGRRVRGMPCLSPIAQYPSMPTAQPAP